MCERHLVVVLQISYLRTAVHYSIVPGYVLGPIDTAHALRDHREHCGSWWSTLFAWPSLTGDNFRRDWRLEIRMPWQSLISHPQSQNQVELYFLTSSMLC